MEKEARHPSKKAGGTSTDSGGPTALALRLSNKISDCEEHEGQNIMFSPLSIYTALGLLAAGARGDTLDEILAVLGAASRDEVAGIVRAVSERALVADNPSGPLVVTSACSLWCQKDLPLKPAYKKAAVESYKADARAVDFVRKPDDAREEINRWVTEATKKLITTVLPPGSVHGDTRLVLANAIYFKGKWEKPFLKSRTKDKLFHRLDGSDVRVPFMTGGKAGDYMVACHDRFKVLKLPYMQATNKSSGARYSMCIFLPTARDGLRSLADEMASGGPGFLFDHLPTWSSSLTKLRLPKFKLSFFCSMKKALESLGLRAAFGEEADLSDMVREDSGGNDVPLRVEDVFHRAVVEVNEEGTEAAAFIDMGMVLRCGKVPVDDFIANHPFAFFIVEEVSRTVVFAGHVLDPSKTTE